MTADFKGFANAILNSALNGYEVTPEDAHLTAEEHGLLQKFTAKEPCGDDCDCRGLAFPTLCYRKTYDSGTPFKPGCK